MHRVALSVCTLALFEGTDAHDWPIFVKTVFASATAASMRVLLVPLDTCKIVMQVQGAQGIPRLVAKVRVEGAPVLFRGAMAWSAATFVSHYPWFTVFNGLNHKLPNYSEHPKQLLRNAGIGFSASLCSDTVSNSLRVIKTVRQTSDVQSESYASIVRNIIKNDGMASLLGRGLHTRLLANGISGIMFSVLYKLGEEHFNQRGF